MKINCFAAALVAVLACASAFAQTAPASGVTRAQVRAELAQARADGSLPLSEASFLPYQFATAATRAAADAERTAVVTAAPRQASAAEPIPATRR